MASRSFQQLATWRQAMDLTHRLFHLTERFPAEERSGVTGTLRRVSAALAAKIAEAAAYDDAARLRDACLAARGTLCEIQTHLLIARRLGYARAWWLWGVQRAIGKLDATLGEEIHALSARCRQQRVAEAAGDVSTPRKHAADNASGLRRAA